LIRTGILLSFSKIRVPCRLRRIRRRLTGRRLEEILGLVYRIGVTSVLDLGKSLPVFSNCSIKPFGDHPGVVGLIRDFYWRPSVVILFRSRVGDFGDHPGLYSFPISLVFNILASMINRFNHGYC